MTQNHRPLTSWSCLLNASNSVSRFDGQNLLGLVTSAGNSWISMSKPVGILVSMKLAAPSTCQNRMYADPGQT
jgi:hypothetical protein